MILQKITNKINVLYHSKTLKKPYICCIPLNAFIFQHHWRQAKIPVFFNGWANLWCEKKESDFEEWILLIAILVSKSVKKVKSYVKYEPNQLFFTFKLFFLAIFDNPLQMCRGKLQFYTQRYFGTGKKFK